MGRMDDIAKRNRYRDPTMHGLIEDYGADTSVPGIKTLNLVFRLLTFIGLGVVLYLYFR